MNLQVMDALGVKKAFVLETSQGGWITLTLFSLICLDWGRGTGWIFRNLIR